ncbi:uncharacterized protein LOC141661230 [Apium graveolens]|uniref:uncharacterized protein LOC141661230 n=1 Tax=Apium graveolens TaxID=4045 RepID=UPI003D790D9F
MDVQENGELRGKPVEDLVLIPLDSLDPEKVTDVFAWTSADMPGIDPKLITHRLNVDPTRKAVKQKKRTYAPDRLEAIKQEVEKLLEAGFIEEVQFPEWLANPVMVKKANGKWRMCIDFTDLNDACPKDCYPLPRINTLIDATAGHEMLSFMDGFSGYNQIKMHKDDTPKTAESQETFEQLKKYMTEAPLLAKPSPEDTLYLYLAVSEQAVSAVLIKKEQKLQKPVYYVSKVLHEAELNYSTTEKYALALITASRKLRPYFQAHKIEVLTDQPLRNILHSLKASGRIIKWAIELGEFDIKYKPRTAIKDQTLADFVVECTINNKKFGGGGQEILDFPTANNEAKYEALIADLGLAKAVSAKNLKVCRDSRLVVAQVNGEFEVKDETMAKYLRVIKGILTQFDELPKWYAEHVPREENTIADALSQSASSEIENYLRSIYFQVLKTPTIHVIKLIALVGVTSCWIDPIKTHLETRWLSDDAREAPKLSVRAWRYSLIEGLLYKRSFVIPYIKCLRPLEADEVLKEAYEGICGQHLGCQRQAPIVRQPPERLISITTPIPFAMWGMDILGPFPVALGHRNIKLRFTSVAHPQENGQAEVANRIILDELNKRVERSRNTWADELLPILWAYHTTCKVTTKATLFLLAYGVEAVVPLEITHGSPRIEAYEPENNEECMRFALDLIDEVRDEANACNAEHQRRAFLYYNRRVKERFFQ